MFNSSLSKEITVILVIKLLVLVLIKCIWFSQPSVPDSAPQPMTQRLLGSAEKNYEGEPR
ncbi:cytochrome oxidase putative small subunit CydP [Pseudomonas protegens]|uniref:cytochrome oxidase putative small subunit CydP n=1 Tax=Pseudomonas protegens TaxID=380021 RepID=UPI0039061D70